MDHVASDLAEQNVIEKAILNGFNDHYLHIGHCISIVCTILGGIVQQTKKIAKPTSKAESLLTRQVKCKKPFVQQRNQKLMTNDANDSRANYYRGKTIKMMETSNDMINKMLEHTNTKKVAAIEKRLSFIPSSIFSKNNKLSTISNMKTDLLFLLSPLWFHPLHPSLVVVISA
jgi:hypothetical protein